MKFNTLLLAVAATPLLPSAHAAPTSSTAPTAKTGSAAKPVSNAKKPAAAVKPAAAKAAPLKPKPIAAPVAANVNGENILVSDVEMMVPSYLAQNPSPTPPTPQMMTAVRSEILDSLIEKKLLLQEATRRKITVKPEELDKGMAEVKGNFPDAKAFKAFMVEQKTTEAGVRKMVGEGLVLESLVKKVGDSVVVSDADVVTFYNANKDKFKEPEQVAARHILLTTNPQGTPEEKEKVRLKAAGLVEQLKGGADFSALAKANSEDPGSKENGGDLGAFSRGEMVKPFEEAAFGAAVGEVVGPIETQFGFHIIQVEKKMPERTIPLEEIQKDPRLKAFLTRRKGQEEFNKLLTSLKAKAKIVRTAVKA